MSGRDQIDDLRALVGLVTAHEQWRGGCLNLVASENIHSPLLGRLLASDLSGRYGDYSGRDLRRRRYQGTRYITEIEELADRLARSMFGARYVELRPLSGHLAAIAAILALARPGDMVLEVDRHEGGVRREQEGRNDLPEPPVRDPSIPRVDATLSGAAPAARPAFTRWRGARRPGRS